MQDQQFVLDIKTIRERARRHIENGAMTPGYKAKAPVVPGCSMMRSPPNWSASSAISVTISWPKE